MFHALLAQLVKTPGMKIPGVFLCLLFSLPSFSDCGHPAGPLLKVARVSDGDTIRLEDGRSVRVLGVNAPEIARGQKSAQPLGREARAAAQLFIKRAGGRVRLGVERKRQDHYGRLLAHVYDPSGRSLAVELLRQGLGLQVAVPPNDSQAGCLSGFEQLARQRAQGVWRNSYWNAFPVSRLRATDAGFRHLRGRVVKVDVNSSVWIEFEGALVAKVAKKDWPAFGYGARDWLLLKGREVELRGWVASRQITSSGSQIRTRFKPLLLVLRSPTSLRVM